MEGILQWGLDWIRHIQSGANPPLSMFMRIITGMGSITAYMILLPLIYWCIDEKKCLRLGIILLISVWITVILKLILDQPRPFFAEYDPSVGLIPEKLGGFPSGHAQNSLVLLMIIASWGKKKLFFAIAALFCLLIGFSRIYLGVHFPTDVLGGWLIGGFLLCIYFLTGKRIETLLASNSPRAGLLACAALAFAMIMYRPSQEPLMPAGFLLGLGTGYFLCRRYIGFTASKDNRSGSPPGSGVVKYLVLAVRFALGITVMVLLYVLTGKIISYFSQTGNYDLLVFIRFVLIALWVTAGAPWLFCILRIYSPNPHTETWGHEDTEIKS
ncbi:MAG: phosphatase PAP2 family protein [Treponema sp.]|nr:phosphatase PAP2 family protein [Treponema sp.]